MLGLLIAWRLLRLLRPLLLCGVLALGLGLALHGRSPLPPAVQRPLTHLSPVAGRSLSQLAASARRTLTGDLERALRPK